MKGKVYIVHEYGAPSHFYALDYLLASRDIPSDKYELNLLGQLKEAVKKRSFRPIIRMLRNLGFLLSLPFLKPAKMVLGLAPYDRTLALLRPFLKRHQVYYFTSYTCWDGSREVHPSGPRTRAVWLDFLRQDAVHIFAVSEKTRAELLRNGLADESRVSVVGHSYVSRPMAPEVRKKDNGFIAACSLVPWKGIEELLDCFSARPEAHLTIVGRGPLVGKVKAAEAACPNIHYAGYITDQKTLFETYRQHSFFVLNSKRTAQWEELFGMGLIEVSACGLVPLAPTHSGPCEILQDGENGVLFEEGDLSSALDRCLGWSDDRYDIVRQGAIANGGRFYVANMADRWKKVLE